MLNSTNSDLFINISLCLLYVRNSIEFNNTINHSIQYMIFLKIVDKVSFMEYAIQIIIRITNKIMIYDISTLICGIALYIYSFIY